MKPIALSFLTVIAGISYMMLTAYNAVHGHYPTWAPSILNSPNFAPVFWSAIFVLMCITFITAWNQGMRQVKGKQGRPCSINDLDNDETFYQFFGFNRLGVDVFIAFIAPHQAHVTNKDLKVVWLDAAQAYYLVMAICKHVVTHVRVREVTERYGDAEMRVMVPCTENGIIQGEVPKEQIPTETVLKNLARIPIRTVQTIPQGT